MFKMISLLAALAWVVIESMVCLNPSSTTGIYLVMPRGMWFLVLSPVVVFMLPYMSARAQTASGFFLRLGGSLMVLILLGWYAGVIIHRDFFSFPAQIVMLYTTLFLARIDSLEIVRHKPEVYRFLHAGAMLMFSLWIMWLMLMSYTIVTRSEPRWIEASAYNLVNGMIGILLLYTASTLRDRAKRVIRLDASVIYLDHRDISAILSPQESLIVSLFLQEPGHMFTCDALFLALKREHLDDSGQAACGDCHKNRWNASKCHFFRNLKNRISDAKKFLELLQIGTIVPVSENPREIKENGWRLRLFDDVRYEANKKLAHVRQ